jgi:hypothetical protein
MKQSVVQRYLRELASGNLGVYFDTDEGGSILPLDGRPRDWNDWTSSFATKATSSTFPN